jgi:hypothetical protein
MLDTGQRRQEHSRLKIDRQIAVNVCFSSRPRRRRSTAKKNACTDADRESHDTSGRVLPHLQLLDVCPATHLGK